MITVLYVDDEPSLLEIAKAFLEREGEISVETSGSAMDALVRLETRTFDAVICDYQMPVVDGIRFLKTIRMQGRDVPFILFTGKGREDVAKEALNNGADFYLQKGGDPEAQFTELLNMVQRSVQERRGAEGIRESEEIYAKLFKDNVEAMVLVDPATGAIADVNAAATALFGYPRERMLSMNIAETFPGLGREELMAMGHDRIGQGATIVMPNRLASGEVREAEVFSGMLRVKGRVLGYAIIHDITETRRAQRREERLNRVFKVLSVTSQLILHAKGEIELLQGSCEALVGQGGYMAVWMGSYVSGSEGAHEVVRCMRKGLRDEGTFPLMGVKLSQLSEAVRKGQVIVLEKAAKDGVRGDLGGTEPKAATYAALPIQINEVLSGVIIIVSDDPDAMEDSEPVLLQELADNLSEAISYIFERELESARLGERAAEGSILMEMFKASTSGVLLVDGQLRLTLLNPRATSIIGRKEEELMGMSILDAMPDARGSDLEVTLRDVMSTGMSSSVDHFLPYTYPMWLRVAVLPFANGLGLVFQDITGDKERESERSEELELLRQMVELSSIGVMVIDAGGKVVYANVEAEKVLNQPREALVGKVVTSMEWKLYRMDGSSLSLEDVPFAKVMRTGEPVRGFRFGAEWVPGKRRYLSVDSIPLKGKDGRVEKAITMFQDITGAMEAEEASKRGAPLLQELFMSTLDAIVKLDGEGKVLFVSPAVRGLLGIDPEDLVGKRVVELIHPDDQERMRQSFQEAFKAGGIFSARMRLRRGDGYVVVEVVGRMALEQGGSPSFVGSVRDITSRQMAEDKLWETGSKLRAIIQTSPMAIISLDAGGSINTWNPAAEMVFSMESVDSLNPFPFLPQDDTEATARLKERILAGEALTDIEVRSRTSDGRERYVSMSTAPILDQSGKVASIILVASDITERKGMEDRLIQLNDLLRLVNRILRHDTLNELMVLSGSLDMYQRTKQERFLTTATKAVNRSMEMIKRMKELEALAASGGAMRLYDLRQTVENVLRGYMIEFSVDGEGSIFADDALPSAIDNIVRNAMIHGKADAIQARVWTDEAHCYLRISDNGIGIPDQVKKRIFEEGFSYGSNAGTGLGLYLVTRAVDRYGGKVAVEDNQPKGAAFVMTFPRA